MEFDVGTFIYIVLGIIYFIFSSTRKNNKKAPKTSRPRPPRGPETVGPPPVEQPTFEELLEEFTGRKKEVEVELVRPEPVIINEPTPKVAEVKRDYRLKSSKKPKPVVVEEAKTVEAEYADDYSDLFENLDDVKRAFIASEVFKRKY